MITQETLGRWNQCMAAGREELRKHIEKSPDFTKACEEWDRIFGAAEPTPIKSQD